MMAGIHCCARCHIVLRDDHRGGCRVCGGCTTCGDEHAGPGCACCRCPTGPIGPTGATGLTGDPVIDEAARLHDEGQP
jgi:hypothetical protein